jgi:MFS transporter, MHS family, alpha-ketoglutarate permease
VFMVACGAFVGALCDRYGNSRVFTIVRLSVPTMLLVLIYTAPGIWIFAAVMLIGGVSLALNQTLFNFMIATLMPEESRTTGMAIAYCIAVAVFGGTASYILLWSQQHGLLWLFAGYAAALCLVSVVLYRVSLAPGPGVHRRRCLPSSWPPPRRPLPASSFADWICAPQRKRPATNSSN